MNLSGRPAQIEVTWEKWADATLGLPQLESEGASGFDLRANIRSLITVRIKPGERKLVNTGLRFAIPRGLEMQIRSRSGLAARDGIISLNSPGTIDSDYRGPVVVILYNTSHETFNVQHGMRIAQGVITPVVTAEFTLVDSLSETVRGSGGLGSTGMM